MTSLSGATPASGAQQSAFAAAFSGVAGPALGAAFVKTTAAIPDSAATTVATLSVPNADCSCAFEVLVRTAVTASSHNYDSSRVVKYLGIVSRRAGLAAVLTLSAAVGPAIATLAAGQTLTSALSAAGVVGGNTVTQTFDLQITNVLSTAGVSETTVSVELLNGSANLVTVS